MAAFEIVLADGSLVRAHPDGTAEEAALFAAGRVGLGALGVPTSVNFHVEPAFTLRAVEEHRTFAEVVDTFRHWIDDELMENTVFGAVNRVGNLVPSTIRGIKRISARAQSDRRYSDVSHRVCTTVRRVRSPVEVRHAPADDLWLSPAHERDVVFLACHVDARTDHRAYFAGVEQVLRAYEGRPHWGKLHTRTAADLAPDYPPFADFVALRDRLDPDRVFANEHLDRVLGA